MAKNGKVKDSLKRYILKERSAVNRFAVSALLLIFSLFVIGLLQNIEGAKIYSLVLAASVLSVIHGGLLPAVCVSVFGALALDYLFAEPVGEVFDSINSFLRFFLYSATATLISIVVTLLRNSLLETEELKNVALSANSAKDNLIAVIAHDLRNPLGVILGFSDLVKSKTHDEAILSDLKIIEKNAAVSLDLINDLQELASLESPDFKLNTSLFNINEVLEDIRSSMSQMCAKKRIEVRFPAKDTEVLVSADPHLVRRVFQNLVDNAIKYSPQGATVQIEVNDWDKTITVAIKDQGLGIREEEQKKIFTPFYRSANKPTGGESSTGLGLATVSAILKAHKATISLESQPGLGSTFLITFLKS